MSREPPEILTPDESRALLHIAEQLWKDLQENQLGGYSGINRPFWIECKFRKVIEQFGKRDIGQTWSFDDLQALGLNSKRAQPTTPKEPRA